MNVVRVSRRRFLQISGVAATGLVLGCTSRAPKQHASLNAFVEIGEDDLVTIYIPRSEMGQAVTTSLAMLLAEDLEADWRNVRARQADLDAKYGTQNTFADASVHESWEPLRKAGAAARVMLVSAAAKRWNVPPTECVASNGIVRHARHEATYGQLAVDAAKMPVPKIVALKSPRQFRLIGKPITRPENRDLVTGRTVYGIDVIRDGMLFASVERCPMFGGTIATVDDAKARTIHGVKSIVRIPADRKVRQPWAGVAVVADSTWSALKGREALRIEFANGSGESSDSYRRRLEAGLTGAAIITKRAGNPERVFATAARTLEATYEFPFLAHATMEPPACVVDARANGCEVWAPTQSPERVAMFIAQYLGYAQKSIRVHVTALGGGFGRKIYSDFVLECAYVSKQVGAPVRLMMTREDDIRHDWYRPAQMHRVRAALGPRGNVIAWHHRIAAPSVTAYVRNEWKDEYASHDSYGAADIDYDVPNIVTDFRNVDCAVPRGVWRSVSQSVTNFSVQTFLDEIAAATNKDPLQLRRELLLRAPRTLRVLDLAAEKAGWGRALPAGRARGIALLDGDGAQLAQVAEVSIGDGGRIAVHRVTCAIDCGVAVNPDGVRAQIEGGIAFGLSAALHGEITIANGAAAQSNFHDYPLLTMSEMPDVDVHIVPSDAAPDGVGEPPVPPVASAVANAVYTISGKRIRRLPFG